MAFKNGHCGLMLNLKPTHTITDLVEWEDDTVDPEVVENLLVTHKSGVSLLPAPESPLDADLITVAVLDQAWPYLRSRYRFMVVDAGSELSEVTLAILERAHVVVLVLTPELASLKAATDALRIFERLGLEGSRVFPVINWTFPQDGLPQRSIENALGAKAKEVIPYERTAFVRAINSGRPLITTDPAADASLAIARLAYRSSAAEMETEEITNPSQLLTMVRQLVGAR
jgi:pilus assembly protein CpaE